MKKLFIGFLLIIILAVLFINSVILISSWINPDEVPGFFGWKPFITLSGSMETEIFAGDLAIVREVPAETLKIGDVIAFKQGDIVITHRIIKIQNENGSLEFITKGDNNNTQDLLPVKSENVEGKYMFKIAKLGNVAMFVQTPLGTIVVIAVPILIILLAQINNNKNYKTEAKDNEIKMQKEIEKLKAENKKLAEKK